MIIEFIFIRPRGREYRGSCLSRKNARKQARKNLIYGIEFCGEALFFLAFCCTNRPIGATLSSRGRSDRFDTRSHGLISCHSRRQGYYNSIPVENQGRISSARRGVLPRGGAFLIPISVFSSLAEPSFAAPRRRFSTLRHLFCHSQQTLSISRVPFAGQGETRAGPSGCSGEAAAKKPRNPDPKNPEKPIRKARKARWKLLRKIPLLWYNISSDFPARGRIREGGNRLEQKAQPPALAQ